MTPTEPDAAVKTAPGGSIVFCRVQPNAGKTALAGRYGNSLKITLKSPPADGKANKELRRFFAELAEVPPSSVKLLSGLSSRDKRVFVPASPELLRRKCAL